MNKLIFPLALITFFVISADQANAQLFGFLRGGSQCCQPQEPACCPAPAPAPACCPAPAAPCCGGRGIFGGGLLGGSGGLLGGGGGQLGGNCGGCGGGCGCGGGGGLLGGGGGGLGQQAVTAGITNAINDN